MNAYMGRERCVMQVVLISESGQFSSLLSLSSSQPLAASCLLLLSLGHYHDSPFPSFLSVLSASMTVPLAPPSYFRPLLILLTAPFLPFPSLLTRMATPSPHSSLPPPSRPVHSPRSSTVYLGFLMMQPGPSSPCSLHLPGCKRAKSGKLRCCCLH